MHLKSQKAQLIVLVGTAAVLSRLWLASLNDPEGPNLLVAAGATLVVYVPSWVAYVVDASATNLKKFLRAIVVQVLVVAALWLWLK